MALNRPSFRVVLFPIISLLLLNLCYSQESVTELKSKIEKFEKEGNKIELASNYNKLAKLYWDQNKLADAVDFFEKSLAVNTELGNANAQRIISGYLGLICLEKEDYTDAVSYFSKSLELNKKAGKNQEMLSDLYNIATAYQMLGKLEESNKNAQKALDLALEANNLESAKSCNLMLAENYEKLGDSKKSAAHFTNYNTLVKHLQQQELSQLATEKKIAESQVSQVESKISQKEKELKTALDTLGQVMEINREMQLQQEVRDLKLAEQESRVKILESQEKYRKTQFRLLGLVIALILAFLVLFIIQSRQRKFVNKKLKEQNSEIEKQKLEIEKQRDLSDKQRKNLTDSIQYARRIQSAVIPRAEELYEYFKDSFILYRPRDIVSGDFYWFAQKDNIIVVAVADCTGHGVPGAFMSMLGVAYLNEIVNKIAINIHINALNADEILNQLREKVILSLHQSDNKSDSKDGMDIALCIIDVEKKKMQFAGANNPVIIIRKNQVIQLKGDNMPVSYHQRKDVPFTRNEFELQNNDCLYLFSDGYTDQYGGPEGRKFLVNHFTNLLLANHQKSMPEQKKIIEAEFDAWKGVNSQIDDVLVIGFRFGKSTDTKTFEWQDKSILVAEDTDINYYLIAEVLRKTKVKIIRVKNGAEAVDFVKLNSVDLVLMDINMPIMNGYEATKQIKEHNQKIPVIIQTAVFEDGLEQSLQVGADDFVSKPIDLKTFMDKISRFL
jgi:CheY-like chemotaxis protein